MRVNAITSIHFPKQAAQEVGSVNHRVERMFPSTDSNDRVPSLGELLTKLLAPDSGCHSKFVGHFLCIFNTKGPLIFKEEWKEVRPIEVYSFIRILLTASANQCSLSDVYIFSQWRPKSVEYDVRVVVWDRMTQLIQMLDNIQQGEMAALEKLFSEALVPFIPTTSHCAAYDDEQQRKGNRKKMGAAVSVDVPVFRCGWCLHVCVGGCRLGYRLQLGLGYELVGS